MILVFVLDGLRPEALNPSDSPTLCRLRQEGVNYLNSHAVFPPVTRVNAAAIATGTYLGSNGLVSNVMSVAQVSQSGRIDTANFRQLLALAEVSNGQLLLTRTLGERLQEHGRHHTGLDGRVLHEALLDGPDEEQVAVETSVQATTARQSQYRATIQVSQVGPYRSILIRAGACASVV